MSAEPSGGGQRAFEVYLRSGAQAAEVAAAERLRREVRREAIPTETSRGETHAVHRDARALGEVFHHLRASDRQASARGLDRAQFLNDSGEHPGILPPRIHR